MKVILSTIGRFHIFPLAKQLQKKGYLIKIYSGFPWGKLEREGVSKKYVQTFPWVRPLIFINRFLPFNLPKQALDIIHEISLVTLDYYVSANLPQADIFVGHEGVGLISGAKAQKKGMIYICDRGCTHMAWSEKILKEEYELLGLPPRVRPRTYEREIAEYKQADLIIVPAQFVADTFIQEGISTDKIAVVSYGVNLSVFNKIAEPAKDSFDVLFVGNISARKGVTYLIEGFKQAKIKNKKLKLVGVIAPEMRSIIEKELHSTEIEWYGPLPQSELKPLMSSSHVFCLPSIDEGFGMVTAEAMACGTPVIVTTNAGSSSLVDDSKNGFVIPIRRPDIIASKLETLAHNPQLRDEMAKYALESVQKLGGWDSYGEEIIKVYKKIISEKNSADEK